MKPAPKDLKTLRHAVVKASDGRPGLSEFLTLVSALHPDLAAAAEGIYCGREGRVSAPVADWNLSLNFNWYSNDARKYFVEWSYLS